MKRKWICLLALIVCITFTACGTKNVPDKGSAEKSTEVTTETKKEAEPVLTEINRLVLSLASKYYLTDSRMEGYEKAMNAVFAHESAVQLTDSYDDNLAIMGYLQESPYAFVLSKFDITSDHKGLHFEYAYSAEECEEMMNFIDREYLTLINDNITEDMTELEKVLAIHKYFAARIEYDYDWVDELNMSDDKYLFPDIVVYQALTTNKGVCHTYTYLCEFAFQQLGIDSIRASARMKDSDVGHMWPIVRIDGVNYHCDPTWDRNGSEVSLRYFGMTDEENEARGVENEWCNSIDCALDIACSDDRFASWRDIVNYELIGNHQMKVVREDGSTEIIDLQ